MERTKKRLAGYVLISGKRRHLTRSRIRRTRKAALEAWNMSPEQMKHVGKGFAMGIASLLMKDEIFNELERRLDEEYENTKGE